MLTRRQLFSSGIAAAACFSSFRPALSRTYVDSLGNSLHLPAPPERIVAINPAMVESLFAIGAGHRVVGIGGKVLYPNEALTVPSVGGMMGVSPEAVLALKPDLVVVAIGTEAATKLLPILTDRGVSVFLASYSDFASILRYISLLGDAVGAAEGARKVVAGMEARVQLLSERLAGIAPVKVYVETGAAGNAAFQTVRSGHYADDAIRLAHGRNVFTDLKGPPQITVEGLAAADPDRIVVLASDPNLTADAVSARPGWSHLRAVREKRVVVMARSFMLIPGPRQAEAIDLLARAIHPEAFG